MAIATDEVKVWEDCVELPTYSLAEIPFPVFYWTDGHHCYPYHFFHEHVGPFKSKKKEYIALTLENRHLKIIMLPELGGRIYSAFDKTTGRELFFKNDVIKPRNLGVGSYIGCGVELNIPDAHSITTARRREYRLNKSPDGSAAITIGETDHLYRIRWHITIRLRPGKAFIEQDVRVHNRGYLPGVMRYWANASIPATDGLQLIFPERTADQHGQSDFRYFSWPVFAGIDISFWKNVPETLGLYMTNVTQDYFGYYNHDYQLGVVHIADHNLTPGKKYWCWGKSQLGKAREKNFSDSAGPYAEMQAGRLINQDHFEILAPQQIIFWKEYWYPYTKIGAFKHANRKAVVNIEPIEKNNTLAFQVGASVPEELEEARIRVENESKCWIDECCTIKIGEPFLRTIQNDALSSQSTLTLTVFDKEGNKIIEYTYRKEELLDSATSGLLREQQEKQPRTAEEFFALGKCCERRRQFKEAIDCYRNVLKIDQGHPGANIALGKVSLSQGRISEAIDFFRKALETDEFSGEAHLYLGITLLKRGDLEEAISSLWNAVRYHEEACGYYYLGEAYLKKKDYPQALVVLDRALDHNSKNTKAMALKVMTLRKMGYLEEAQKVASEGLSVDAFDLLLRWELSKIKLSAGEVVTGRELIADTQKQIHDDPWTYMELAMEYANTGAYLEAIELLEAYVKLCEKEKGISQHAGIHYLLAEYYHHSGRQDLVEKHLTLATKAERVGIHPNRLEELESLDFALSKNRTDTTALYLRGNFYFSKGNFEAALKDWQRAQEAGDNHWLLLRNLAHSYWKVWKDGEKAATLYKKALKLMPQEPNLVEEFCNMLAQQGNKQEQINLLEKATQAVKISKDLTGRLAQLYIDTGRYNDCFALLENAHFEGWCQSLHLVWEEACVARAIHYLRSGQPKKTLDDLKRTFLYPENLGSGPRLGPPYVSKTGDARVLYYLGLAYETLGDHVKAKETWEKAVAEKYISLWTYAGEYALWLMRYYQALALNKLGRSDEAKVYFDGLAYYAKKSIWDKKTKKYLLNLANEGKKMKEITEYTGVVEIDTSKDAVA